jgi:putative transposase
VPRDHWLTEDEKEQICIFARQHTLEGYRLLTFMMLDADIVACSPASVYRVLKANNLLAGASPNVTKKGTGFVQPLKPHEHWHIDVSHLNIAGTFYFICSILDGYSRFIVHQEIREKMEESDVEIIIQRARETFPNETPRIISDNGPQFIAKNFKEFIRTAGMTHVKTSPYYPQSNGKKERWYKTLKGECIRVKVPLSLEEARRIVDEYTVYYNTLRLHSAIDYIAPKDKLEGRDKEILAARERKLAEARERRKQLRQAQHEQSPSQPTAASRPPIDFPAVRAAISMAAVLQLLGFIANSTKGAQLRGPCPLHGSTSGTSTSFSANLNRNAFHCFKCRKQGNALDLWAQVYNQTIYDAAINLCERLNIPLPTLPLPTRHREEEPVANRSNTCTMSAP